MLRWIDEAASDMPASWPADPDRREMAGSVDRSSALFRRMASHGDRGAFFEAHSAWRSISFQMPQIVTDPRLRTVFAGYFSLCQDPFEVSDHLTLLVD